MAIICPGCNLSIEPIAIFEHDAKTKQWWRITKCPRERCSFNLDIHECDKPAPKSTKKPIDVDDKQSGWRYGL